MASGVRTIHVKKVRGQLVVQGDGQTPRGKKFIRATAQLKAKNMADPDFKAQLATAVEQMLAQSPLPL